MNKLIDETWFNTLLKKSYLYDTNIAPIVKHYTNTILALQITVIILSIIVVGLFIFYIERNLMVKYLKAVLNANFGWFE